jgi:HK97 family phage major capsid protein
MTKHSLKELRQRAHDLKAKGREKIEALKKLDAVAEPSAEQAAQITALNAELDQLEKDALEAQAAVEAEEKRLNRERLFGAAAPARPTVPATVASRDGPFRSLGEQLLAVRNAAMGQVDNRLFAAAQGANEAVGADGGFLVQQEFSNELLGAMHETGILASRCRRIPAGAGANAITMPMVDETSRADGSRWGAVRAYWESEAGTLTASRPKFSKLELKLGKLTGLFYATDELLQDATALSAVASQAFQEEFGFKLDDAIIRGTGAGMPLGILNAACKVEQAKETSQTAATINADNVLKMMSRMPAGLRAGAVWLINEDAEPQLPKMTIGDQPIYLPPGGLRENPYGNLLGRPVLPIEQCETLGTAGDIIFANLSQYLLYEKGGVEQASSIHVQFLTAEQVFRWILRIDGKPRWKSALTPFKGSATKSPFVTLATRS